MVIYKLIIIEGMELRLMKKVLFLGDLGIDDFLVIMYGLLYFDIDIVGVVMGYGNVI